MASRYLEAELFVGSNSTAAISSRTSRGLMVSEDNEAASILKETAALVSEATDTFTLRYLLALTHMFIAD